MQLQAMRLFAVKCAPSPPEYDWEYLEDEETTAKCLAWENLARTLNDGELSDSSVLAIISEDFSSGYFLHEAISAGIPEHVLMLLVDRFPALLAQVDDSGWHPVHTACACGASWEFVAYCIDTNPSSVAARDAYGQTPAHLLCHGTWHDFWDKTNPAAENNMSDILTMLFLKSPSSVVSEDYHGVGCIESAIDSNLGIKIIELLQNMTRHFNENKTLREAHQKRIDALRQSQRKNSLHSTAAAQLSLYLECSNHRDHGLTC